MARIDADKVRSDIKALGITQTQVSYACGFSKHWLGNILDTGTTNLENIRRIETALFKPEGTYEIKVAPEPKEEPKPAQNNAQIMDLLKELLKVQNVIRAQNEELLSAIHAWRKTNTDQNAKLIEKSTEHITQQLKTRSMLERRLSNETL